MKFSRKTFAFVLGLALILAISLSAYSKTDAQTIQDQVDQLLADYQKALEYELEHGQTVEVDDPETGKTRVLTGESLAKMEALWDETQRQINALVARPEEERAKVVQLIQSIEPGEVIYSHQNRIPYYDLDAKIEVYTTARNNFTVDIATGQVIEIFPVGVAVKNTKQVYSQGELEQKARDLIALVAGVDLNTLTPNFGTKQTDRGEDKNFFFRWEDTTFKLSSGVTPFIQVGFSKYGVFLNYINTLPFGQDLVSKTSNDDSPSSFNEIYANDGGHWQLSGTTSIKDPGGFCYIYRTTYPTLCGSSPSPLWTFRYKTEQSTLV